MIPAVIAAITTIVGRAVDAVLPDPAQKAQADQIKSQIVLASMQQDTAALQSAVEIIKAEAQGESWLQRNWRPILMLTIVCIIANNYIAAPYINALFGAGSVPLLELPARLWDLMTLGVGGYVGGRTIEKVAETIKGAVAAKAAGAKP